MMVHDAMGSPLLYDVTCHARSACIVGATLAVALAILHKQ